MTSPSEGLREKIARMINPAAFAMQNNGRCEPGQLVKMLALADRILALPELSRPAPPEGWRLLPVDPGTCEGDDSGWVLAFFHALHAHLPEDERPTSWMQFSDGQRERVASAYRAMLAASPEPPRPAPPSAGEWRERLYMSLYELECAARHGGVTRGSPEQIAARKLLNEYLVSLKGPPQ